MRHWILCKQKIETKAQYVSAGLKYLVPHLLYTQGSDKCDLYNIVKEVVFIVYG